MSDDITRQAGKDRRARRGDVALLTLGGEIAEQQGLLVRAVIGIVGAQRVRIDAQARYFIRLRRHVAAASGNLGIVRSPQRATAKRTLEMPDRGHCDGINHLLVELRIAFRWRQAVLCQQDLVVEVDGIVDTVGRRIDIDDLEIFTHRTGQQPIRSRRPVVPRHGKSSLKHRDRIEPFGHRRIERVDAQSPLRRWQRTRLALDRRRRLRLRGGDRLGARPSQHTFEKGAQRL